MSLFRLVSTRTAVCAIALVLWLNFAYIEHQYELPQSQHSQHHCQLFACALHGASTFVVTLPAITSSETHRLESFYYFVESVFFAYLARSPPAS
ncbi:DUF2607 family protein [Vibrio hepatarius]|uniref:DUF2607 family protein n=1 Tax=Vibrio hepatarius TaxID=171383 RepID=UPI003735B2DF